MGFFFSSRRRHTRWTGDWSSDVCSSDLIRAQRPAAQRPDGIGLEVRDLHAGVHTRIGSPRANQRHGCISDAAESILGEIGRASCRERVEISVVAGSLKKKKKTKQAGSGG